MNYSKKYNNNGSIFDSLGAIVYATIFILIPIFIGTVVVFNFIQDLIKIEEPTPTKKEIEYIFNNHNMNDSYDINFNNTLTKIQKKNYISDLDYVIYYINYKSNINKETRYKLYNISNYWKPILEESNDLTRMAVLIPTVRYLLGETSEQTFTKEELKTIYYYLKNQELN